jgi:hypothetical protein
VGLFRRHRETLNEQLLREAGLGTAAQAEPVQPVQAEPAPEPAGPPAFPVGEVDLGHGRSPRQRQHEGDKTVTVRAATLPGERIEFTTLPNGDIIVDREEGDEDLAPLADAVERHVNPPYRAIANRQDEDVWAVNARRIEVATFEFAEGDALVLSVNDGAAELLVDGKPSDAQVPELDQLGERKGSDYCVEADRIDGDVWEVRAFAF